MSSFDILNNDVIIYILEYLNDMDKISFLSVNSRLYSLINNVWFNGIYNYRLIKGLPYINRFKYIKYKTVSINIPDSVTHLTFGNNFNQDVKDCIPVSVTHLKFGHNFDQNVKNCIPNSVIYLTLKREFYERNKKKIDEILL
ncbi:F-box and FNIP repeat-containing protein [Megavirus baoshan]|uniref:F-box and FNIP repeat-containing protein n=1 Tax=Megavirus baoshan TaxID=2496520 RepID=A0A3S8UYV6_9VIRU|nr:F-box and FNIP repeat-containing protein [Megavirus baoshan]AZL89944.1 F-box and FNIP repeat-containing protein [Megavirus baoshan]